MDDVFECMLPKVSHSKTHATCHFPNWIQMVFYVWSRDFLNNETTVRMVLMECLLGDFAKDEITFRAWKLITKTLSKEYARNASQKLHPAISARW